MRCSLVNPTFRNMMLPGKMSKVLSEKFLLEPAFFSRLRYRHLGHMDLIYTSVFTVALSHSSEILPHNGGSMNASKFRAVDLHHSANWFRDLEPMEIDLALGAAKCRRFPARSLITLQGEPADQLIGDVEWPARYFFETPIACDQFRSDRRNRR